MAYDVANPPVCVVPSIGGSPAIWVYSDTDAIGTVVGAGYFTDAASLGMKENDLVLVNVSGSNTWYMTGVSSTVTTVITDATIN